MQSSKLKEEIPFLSCSFGSVLSEVEIIAKKSEPLMRLDEFTKPVILFFIIDLNSNNEVD